MWASLRWSTAAPAIARPGGRGMAAAGRRGRRGGCAPFRRRVLRCTPVALFSRKKCSRGSEDYGTFCVSSKLSFTFAVFPGSTVIGSGVGGFVLYMPSEEPAGGDDCASHFLVGSYAVLTYTGDFCSSVNVTVPVFDSSGFTAAGPLLKSVDSHSAT